MGGLPRRQVLAAIVCAPAVLGLGGCGLLRDDRPDPLVTLADQARADVALAAAVVAADGLLAARVEPVRAARDTHATALEAEITRRDPDAGRTRAAPGPTDALPPTLAGLREALSASRSAATDVALALPVDRVGLVASVAACCGAYAELLA